MYISLAATCLLAINMASGDPSIIRQTIYTPISGVSSFTAYHSNSFQSSFIDIKTKDNELNIMYPDQNKSGYEEDLNTLIKAFDNNACVSSSAKAKEIK
jgi:hypothetical protein